MSELFVNSRVAIWAHAIPNERLSLDSAPCASRDAIRLCVQTIQKLRLESSLIICQSQVEGNAILKVIEELIPDAAADLYPSRKEVIRNFRNGNCKNMHEIVRAVELGLSPKGSVCIVCPHKAGCEYFDKLDKARLAFHVIMNKARATYTDLVKESEGREAVFLVNVAGLDVLCPALSESMPISEAKDSLLLLAEASHQCKVNGLLDNNNKKYNYFSELNSFAHSLLWITQQEWNHRVKLPRRWEPPDGWEASLKGVLDNRGVNLSKHIVRLCNAAVLGHINRLDLTFVDDLLYLAAFWYPRKLRQPVLVLDQTLTPERLSAAVGMPAHHIAVACQPIEALQVPLRATQSMRPGAIAKLIRGYLVISPEATVGIVHSNKNNKHAQILNALRSAERERVRMAEWSQVGGESLEDCDLTLLMGAPPVNPMEVMKRLTQSGELDGSDEVGEWGALVWEGRFESGDPLPVVGRGYLNDAWQRAYRELQGGRLSQVIGSIPGRVFVISDEPLELPLAHPPPNLSTKSLRVLEALRTLTLSSALKSSTEENPSLIAKVSVSARPPKAKVSVKVDKIHASTLARATGVPESTVRRILTDLEIIGLAMRPSGKRSGWEAVS